MRVSKFSIEENLQLNRAHVSATYYFDGDVEYPTVHALDISEYSKADVIAPGLSVGFMMQNEKNFYYDMFLTADFVSYKQSNRYSHLVSYRRTIGSGFNDVSDSQIFSNKLKNGHRKLSAGINLGYFF